MLCIHFTEVSVLYRGACYEEVDCICLKILPLFCGRTTRISKKYLSFYQPHIQAAIKTNGVQNCILSLKTPRPLNPVVINLGSDLAPSVKFTSVSFSGTVTQCFVIAVNR